MWSQQALRTLTCISSFWIASVVCAIHLSTEGEGQRVRKRQNKGRQKVKVKIKQKDKANIRLELRWPKPKNHVWGECGQQFHIGPHGSGLETSWIDTEQCSCRSTWNNHQAGLGRSQGSSSHVPVNGLWPLPWKYPVFSPIQKPPSVTTSSQSQVCWVFTWSIWNILSLSLGYEVEFPRYRYKE